jgi:transposase
MTRVHRSKSHLDYRWLGMIEKPWQTLRSGSDWAVVCEVSGGDETLVATTLSAHGWRVSVVNPRPVRDFAKASGILAKTDAIAERVISL